jgi:hypothetical protein
MRWAGHVARMVKINIYNILLENLKEKDQSEYLDVGRRIILELILEKQGVNVWTGCIWLRIEISGGLL